MNKVGTVLAIALIIAFLDWRIAGGLHTGAVLSLLVYVLLGAIVPILFVPLGIIIIIYLLWAHGTRLFGGSQPNQVRLGALFGGNA